MGGRNGKAEGGDVLGEVSIPTQVYKLINAIETATFVTGLPESESRTVEELQAIIAANEETFSEFHEVLARHTEAEAEIRQIDTRVGDLELNRDARNHIGGAIVRKLFDKVLKSEIHSNDRAVLLALQERLTGYADQLFERDVKDDSLREGARKIITDKMDGEEEGKLFDIVEGIVNDGELLGGISGEIELIAENLDQQLHVVDMAIEPLEPVTEIQGGVKTIAELKTFLRVNFERGIAPFDAIVNKIGAITVNDIRRLSRASELENFGATVNETVGIKINDLNVDGEVSLTSQAVQDVVEIKKRIASLEELDRKEPFINALFTLTRVSPEFLQLKDGSSFNYDIIRAYKKVIERLKENKLSAVVPLLRRAKEEVSQEDSKEFYKQLLLSEYYMEKKRVAEEKLRRIAKKLEDPYKKVSELLSEAQEKEN